MRVVRTAIAAASTAAFVYLAVKGVRVDSLRESLRGVDYLPLGLGAAVSVGCLWLRAWRWRLILRPVKAVGIYELFAITSIGFMANNVLPLRLGEVAKAAALTKRSRIGLSSALASVGVERLFDGIAIGLMSPVLLLVPGGSAWVARGALGLALGLAAAFAVALAGLAILLAYGRRSLEWRPIKRRLGGGLAQKLARLVSGFLHGLSVLRDAATVGRIVLASVVLWLAHAAIYHLVLVSLGIELPVTAPVTALIFTVVAAILPSAPGALGTFEYFCILALAAFAVPKDQALAYAVVLHASMWVPVTVLGLVYAWLMGSGLGGVRVDAAASARVQAGVE